jgi:CheY-like chemotaxis protein
MDDEPAVLESTGAMLESFGYHVLRTSDGREVLEAYDQSVAVGPEIGVFLLDNLIVGGMGGLETAKQLRDRGCRARIILMSGYFSAGDTDGTPDPDRLPKPFTSADLGQVLKKGPAGPQPPVSGSE